MKNYLILFALCLGLSNLALAQSFKMKKSGLFSSFRYFGYVKKHVDPKEEIKRFTVKDLSIKLGDKSFAFRLAYTDLDASKPTVIAHFGLNGQVDDPNVLYLSRYLSTYSPHINFVVIDTLSSESMTQKNCFWTLGGLEDIKLIDHAVKYLRTQTALKKASNPEFLMMGGSGSSFALFHAAKYLNLKYPDLIKGIFILSGYDGYAEYLKYIQTLETINHSERRRDVKDERKKFSFKSRKLGNMLLKTRLKKYNEAVASCEGFSKAKNLEDYSYINLLDLSFEKIKHELEEIYRTTYPEKEFSGFADLFDYHEKIKISAHLNDLDVPLLFMHGENDPLSIYAKMKESLFDKFDQYPLAQAKITKLGGHAAFAWVYGEEWLFNEINLFVDQHTDSKAK